MNWKHQFVVEVNQFADQTFDEFKSTYLIQDPQVSLISPQSALYDVQWRSYTRAHPGTGLGINLFGPGIKNWQESRDYLLINGS